MIRPPAGSRIALLAAGMFASSLSGYAGELYLAGGVIDETAVHTFADICLAPRATDDETLAVLREPLPQLDSLPSLIPPRVVKSLLAAKLSESFILVGSRFVYIPDTVTDPGERTFYVQLLEHLDRSLGDKTVRVEVSIPSGEDLSGIEPGSALSFQLDSGDESPQTLIQNRYVTFGSGGGADLETIPVTISAFGLAPFARHDLSAGSSIDRGDVVEREVDLSSIEGTPARIGHGSYDVEQEVPDGGVLLSGAVREHDAVSEGSPVMLTFEHGAVSVSVPGTAYGAGGLGDTIPVATQSSAQRFTGVIESPSEVIVAD